MSAFASFCSMRLRMEAAGALPIADGMSYCPGAGAKPSAANSSSRPRWPSMPTPPCEDKVDWCAPSYVPGAAPPACTSRCSMRLRMDAAGPCPMLDGMSYEPASAVLVFAWNSSDLDDCPLMPTPPVACSVDACAAS